jgi:hypothetical protein
MKPTLASSLSDLFDALNILSSTRERAKMVQDIFARQHRTLQQYFVAVIIIPILQHLSEQHVLGHVDGRNERAAALANKMLNAVEDDDLYLPLI